MSAPDPDLIEAREICAQLANPAFESGGPADYRDGGMDGAITTRLALLGIRRGRELERGKP